MPDCHHHKAPILEFVDRKIEQTRLKIKKREYQRVENVGNTKELSKKWGRIWEKFEYVISTLKYYWNSTGDEDFIGYISKFLNRVNKSMKHRDVGHLKSAITNYYRNLRYMEHYYGYGEYSGERSLRMNFDHWDHRRKCDRWGNCWFS